MQKINHRETSSLMKFDVEPMKKSTGFEYSSWKLYHELIFKLVLDVFKAKTVC
jgi:hypothetical protein